ncbi:hypothetical protein FLK61_33825 [Paenalkalicoccus suaedae]|uniref:Uncharacterized protein n=1 Tax=Paenalkalicoccus suaedae TaxID=2592382 RepID=A0A859FGA2_9BACI|nr:hypothetical protein [Paenalkalicoccus suaedae]QKS71664.1 hypothetical protein FLK61_33825 [Paenalkalicoccus suaedae]
MPYIDADYYNDEFMGTPVDEADLPRFIRRASDTIDMVTRYKIKDFDTLTDLQKSLVKKAVASQVEYIEIAGGVEELLGDNLQSVTVGKFSAGKGQASQNMGCNLHRR